MKALVDTIMKVQRLAVDNADRLVELDINPLVVLPKGAIALDAARGDPMTSMLVKDRTAIVGIGQTEFAKSIDRSEKHLALEAIKLALDDAGIEPTEVDGLSSYTLETTDETDIARNLGLGDITFFSQVGYGGGAGCGVVGHAAMAVATGQCEVAVAWRSRKRGAAASRPVVAGRGTCTRATPVDATVRLAASRRRDRAAGAPLLPRVRRHARTARVRRDRSAPSRQPQPRRDDARQDADTRAVPRRALDLRAAVPLRQLPRIGRRRRGRHHVARAGARHSEATGADPLVRAVDPPTASGDDELLR